jgi:hypothetical protein
MWRETSPTYTGISAPSAEEIMFSSFRVAEMKRKEAPAAHKERRSTNGKTLLKEKPFILTSAVSSVSLGVYPPRCWASLSLSLAKKTKLSP